MPERVRREERGEWRENSERGERGGGEENGRNMREERKREGLTRGEQRMNIKGVGVKPSGAPVNVELAPSRCKAVPGSGRRAIDRGEQGPGHGGGVE